MKKTLYILISMFVALFGVCFIANAQYSGNSVDPLSPFLSTTTPIQSITQRIVNEPLKITGLTNNLSPICIASNGLATTTGCSGGGGGGGGTFSTTTYNTKLLQYPYAQMITSLYGSSTTTSPWWFDPFSLQQFINASTTIAGQLTVPYLIATSTTATSTFAGAVSFPSGIWDTLGNVGIGTTSPSHKLEVNGTVSFNDPSLTYGGINITSSGNNVQIGYGAYAHGNYSSALGSGANAHGPYSSALGYGAYAGGNYSSALGSGAYAGGNYSSVLGSGANAHGPYSSALGYGAGTGYTNSTVIGSDQSDSGNLNDNNAQGGITLGGYNPTTANGENWLTIMPDATDNNPTVVIGQSTAAHLTVNGTILAGGNLGIGTTSPATKLDVNGTTTVETGDINIRSATGGLILKDTVTGTCARIRLTSGVLVPTTVTCPF